ncbi:uncharacterized protein LOC143864031 [Tasmannia lanceolata]|uniref:uncharacterized protein LOC143864031 n=1 Tax=Tasmannia lanceolata TaxID=3420 RepID=UPI0040629CD3
MTEPTENLQPTNLDAVLANILQQMKELKEDNQFLKAQFVEKFGPSSSSPSKGKEPKYPVASEIQPQAKITPLHIEVPDSEQYAEENHNPVTTQGDKSLAEKFEQLSKKVDNIKIREPDSFNPDNLTLFPEVHLPANFQMPDFDKYNGVGCPTSHLQMFIIMCQPQGLTPEQMAQLFPISLTGIARKWFLSLNKTRYKRWKDIGEQFIKQFGYEDGTEITRRDLETTKQDSNESFMTFVKRWRKKVAHMMDRPSEREQVQIVLKNLSSHMLQHMSLQFYPDFEHFIIAGTQIEDAMALGI